MVTALVQHELGPFTLADWHALPAREDGTRLELIEGYWLVTPPPSGQHQWAEKHLVRALDAAIGHAQRSDLYAVSGVGVELSTSYRTAVIPDLVVLDVAPVGNSFAAGNVLLAGEIWSPGNTLREQRDKFDACADAGIPFFWSIAQDRRGPVELTAYRLDRGRYTPETSAKLDEGPVTITASPVPVEVDLALLHP